MPGPPSCERVESSPISSSFLAASKEVQVRCSTCNGQTLPREVWGLDQALTSLQQHLGKCLKQNMDSPQVPEVIPWGEKFIYPVIMNLC